MPDELRPAERKILRLIARGFSNRQIATKLTITMNNVTTTLTHVRRRWNIQDKKEIVQHAEKLGLLIEPQVENIDDTVTESVWGKRALDAGFNLKSQPEFKGDRRSAFRDRRKRKRRK